VRFNRFFAIFVATVILSLLAVTIFATPALAAPILNFSPSSGTVGTTVTITGVNFTSYVDDQIHIYFGTTEVVGSPVIVSPDGGFTLSFPVPDTAMPGRALVTVRDNDGNQLAKGEFVVPQPSIMLDKGGGVVGTTITVSGTGFYAGQMVAFTLSKPDGSEVELPSDALASDIGECTYVFTIPESTAKEHQVIATDPAGNKAEATLTVIPSVVLQPVSGAIGSEVTATGTGFGYKTSVSIDFGGKQLKTAKTDSDGSFEVTFNVPAMTIQAYNVKITDSEDNTTVGQFTINAGEGSFVFPQVAIYGLMGFGMLVFFIFGIWLGRKYAYVE
jgi:hypothetical protein